MQQYMANDYCQILQLLRVHIEIYFDAVMFYLS